MMAANYLGYYLLRSQKLIIHLKRGSLLNRLRLAVNNYFKRKQDVRRFNKRWRKIVGNQKEVIIEIKPEINLKLFSDSRISLDVYAGIFECNEQKFLTAFLQEGDIFLDIGANIGLFTVIAAPCVGKTGSVYAFEPCRKTFQRLLSNVKLNLFENVRCYQAAISDQSGQRNMALMSDGFDAWNSLARTPESPFAQERVECITLDDFAEKNGLIGRMSLVKIDVEGWENRVLNGGLRSLSRKDAPILMVEFSDATCKLAGLSSSDLYHSLEKLGYRMFSYEPKTGALIPEPLRESYEYLNLIAIKSLDQVTRKLEKYPEKIS